MFADPLPARGDDNPREKRLGFDKGPLNNEVPWRIWRFDLTIKLGQRNSQLLVVVVVVKVVVVAYLGT